MNDYNDGKIHGWNGGECPVHPESEVELWFRGGVAQNKIVAGFCAWEHHNSYSDICAFQVTKPYVEPKVIWVNEYGNGGLSAHYSEDKAKAYRSPHPKCTTVKYVEVKDE